MTPEERAAALLQERTSTFAVETEVKVKGTVFIEADDEAAARKLVENMAVPSLLKKMPTFDVVNIEIERVEELPETPAKG